MSVRAAIAIALALVWLPARPARAYAWMIRHGYTGCATCHVDPSGAGVLTPYGRAQGDILLQSHFGTAGAEAAPSSNFLWNALRLPDWLLGGGGVRAAELATKVGPDATTTDFILMQADIAAAVSTGGFRATASIGGVTSNGSAAASRCLSGFGPSSTTRMSGKRPERTSTPHSSTVLRSRIPESEFVAS